MVTPKTEMLADKLLSKIRRRRGRPNSIASLARSLRASPDEIGDALAVLKTLGYRIRRRKASVTFVSAPDSLIDTEIAYQLKTRVMGKKIYAYRSVKSTNDIAAELALAGEPEGTIVTAEQQTRGRGRLGRSWHSPFGCGIYVSIILKPRFKPEKAPGTAVMTSVALADAIAKFCPADVKIKWPNDVLLAGRKIAGILTELSAEKNRIDYVIIGVGINVNHRVEDFPAELRPIATSLRIIAKRKVRRTDLLQQFLRNMESEYRRYCKSQLAPSRRKIRRYSSLIGRTVRLSFGNRIVEGAAVDIDSTGALIIEKDGQRRQVTSGEVTVVRQGD